MTEIQIEIIGLIAAVLTTSSFLPQVYKIWKLKSADGVSLSMYLFMFTGVMIWFVYGILIDSVAVISANLVAGILQFIIIYFKLKIK
ncbi:MAG: MtN3 and saliva related transmembrane protein [Flavobacteriaceae bacterium]|jgi:MtN3 and saliva related transmembrane protein|tara:strand:- start:2766 stop:3026 length:261 start_codon:yes stop_codon:yes gene_type:complete